MKTSSQKFIARNRAPRVQIEYDVELYGSQKKTQLPFVMGVLSDLSGKSKMPQPAIENRKFLEIDADTFDDGMRAMQPRAAFSVPNTLTGAGNLEVDLTFERIEDFAPAAIAARVEPLSALLHARTQLSDLMTYMDGKSGAETLIEKILADPDLLILLAGVSGNDEQTETALKSLRDQTVETPEISDPTGSVRDTLRSQAPVAHEPKDSTKDVLAGLARLAETEPPEAESTQSTLDALCSRATDEDGPDTSVEDALLSDLAAAKPLEPAEFDAVGAALDSLAEAEPENLSADTTDDTLAQLADAVPWGAPDTDDIDAVLDDLAELDVQPLGSGRIDDPLADLDDTIPSVSAEFKTEEPYADPVDSDPENAKNGDDKSAPTVETVATAMEMSKADAQPLVIDDLEDLVTETAIEGPAVRLAAVDDLDDFLADIAGQDPIGDCEPDDLLAELAESSESPAEPSSSEDTAFAENEAANDQSGLSEAGTDDLDEMLADVGGPKEDLFDDPGIAVMQDDASAGGSDGYAKSMGEPEFAFGVISADRPAPKQLDRRRFRIAVMGDFSGRAASGRLETGDALAKREAIRLDPDTVEEVIAGFGTTLMLPIGKDGAGVEVKLGEFDDLHPDQLYENVAILQELKSIKAQLGNTTTAASAADRLKAWGMAYGTPVRPPKTHSGGNAVPANLKLSDFQKLIGDTREGLTSATPVEEMIARIVGPHVQAVADADTMAMQAAVDEALSSAMRLILHHPEFQSIEAQWRSLDLIARSIETDETLDVMLYDVSAEEIAADLAAADDLSGSGFVRLLTEAPMSPETGRGAYSAVVGLYSFEETPPHAELLGRIAQVAAHVDAPFLAALSSGFMEIEKENRHPLVAKAWDTLRAMPEAGYLGLASPRFLLRRPYGKASEPIYEFDFEEFTMAEGLRSMLWANPVVLVAILMARSFQENGTNMELGSIMSLGGMPYHVITDRFGDQVALPCTERNLTLDKVEKVMARGVMPVVSIKGRDEIRLASFQSVAGGDIRGPWSETPPPSPSPPQPVQPPEKPPETVQDQAEEDDLGLDDLLASFDDAQPGVEPDDIDADLAALLEDL